MTDSALETVEAVGNLAPADRLQLVSSLYGPGAIICWLCTVASVAVSWTLHKPCRRRDTITNDLAAALALPSVAAGHLLHQIIKYPGDRALMFTTADTELLPCVAAIEAPLTVCETFSALALLLFVIAALKLHIKRCIAVGANGLLTFAAESTLFAASPRSPISRSNLSRAYLLNKQAAMVPLMALTGLLALTASTVYLWHYFSIRKLRSQSPTITAVTDAEAGSNDVSRRQAAIARTRQRSAIPTENLDRRPASFKAVTLASVVFLPLSLITTMSFPLGAWGLTPMGALHGFSWRLRSFIPQSSVSLSELDQAVAVGGGLATLLFTLYDTWKERSGV